MDPHASGRRRYRERSAADTVRDVPAVRPARPVSPSDETVLLTGDEADELLLTETGATECRLCGEIERCAEYGLCASCLSKLRTRIPEARL